MIAYSIAFQNLEILFALIPIAIFIAFWHLIADRHNGRPQRHKVHKEFREKATLWLGGLRDFVRSLFIFGRASKVFFEMPYRLWCLDAGFSIYKLSNAIHSKRCNRLQQKKQGRQNSRPKQTFF